MNENEKILKALAMITAELYIQNEIFLATISGLDAGYSYHKKEMMEKLADHYLSYFEGSAYFPGSVAKLIPQVRH